MLNQLYTKNSSKQTLRVKVGEKNVIGIYAPNNIAKREKKYFDNSEI